MNNQNLDNLISLEVAQKIVDDMPKEKIESMAINALRSITSTPSGWEKESQLNKAVKSRLLNAINEEVNILLSTEEYAEKIKKIAQETVEAITIRSKELMIENSAQRLAGIIVDPVLGVRHIIQQTVHEMLNK